MNVEELKKHCEKQINLCSRLNDYKHLEEHQLVLNLIEENKQLKDNWNKVKNIIEDERMSHWTPGPLFLTELLISMEKIEKGESNE